MKPERSKPQTRECVKRNFSTYVDVYVISIVTLRNDDVMRALKIIKLEYDIIRRHKSYK